LSKANQNSLTTTLTNLLLTRNFSIPENSKKKRKLDHSCALNVEEIWKTRLPFLSLFLIQHQESQELFFKFLEICISDFLLASTSQSQDIILSTICKIFVFLLNLLFFF